MAEPTAEQTAAMAAIDAAIEPLDDAVRAARKLNLSTQITQAPDMTKRMIGFKCSDVTILRQSADKTVTP
jgi:hypothetical protein